MSTHRGTMGASPATGVPTTAPVLDYVCLFTHDLKRKQKRWQDGKLKYHTFNKRVMVYDEKANFIGDMHWNEDYEFGDGEEFQLERGCVIVQVAECVGSKEQDLSELIEKRYKDKEQRQARAAAVAAATPSRSRPTPAPSRPLADVSTTPRANYIGRAVIPTESPFEQRQAQNGETPSENARPTKRRKHDVSPPSKSGYAQNLFGAPSSLSSWSASGQTSRSQENNDNPQAPAAHAAVPSRPTYRTQTTASLLQKIRRDRPLDSPLEQDGPVNPMTARQTFSGRPQAASTTAARSMAPPSVQPQQPARPKAQKATFGRGTDATPKETPSRRGRDAPSADKGSSDEDVVETFSRPVRPSPNTHKRAPSPKASPPRKAKTLPKPFSAPKPQSNSRARVLGKPGPAEVLDQEPLNTPGIDQDEMPGTPMLVSTTKPSRRRRLLLVSGPKASKKVVSSAESSNQPTTSRPVIRPPPEVVTVSEPADSDQADGPPTQPPKRKSLSRAPSNPFVDFDSSESDVPLPKRRAERRPSVSAKSRYRKSEEETDNDSDGPSRLRQNSNPFSDDDDVQDFCSAQPRERSPSVPRQQSKKETPVPAEGPKPPGPKPAPSADTAHRFIAPGARLATLRRGVKSKEVLFWPEEEVLSEEEEEEKPPEPKTKTKPPAPKFKSSVATAAVPELPARTDVVKASTARESRSLAATAAPPDPPATTDATKAPATEKEPATEEKPQRRTSTRQTRQLSKPAEKKTDASPAEQKTDMSPTKPTDAPEIAPQEKLPVAVPPPPATVAESSVPSGEAVQANTSFNANPAVQSPQQPATKQQQVPSPEPTGGQTKLIARQAPLVIEPITKPPPPVVQDKDPVDVLPTTTKVRRSMSATTKSATPPPNQPPQIPGQRPRIVNPATRGRKAALKTDAAGQLPQTVVPAALPLATVNQLRMAAPIPMPAPVPVPVLVRKESVTKEKPKLPGFSRAGGGAWSKTAHDLLGMERPA